MEIETFSITLSGERGEINVHYHLRKEDAQSNGFDTVTYGLGIDYESEAYGSDSVYVGAVTSDEEKARQIYKTVQDAALTPLSLHYILEEML